MGYDLAELFFFNEGGYAVLCLAMGGICVVHGIDHMRKSFKE